MKKLLVIGYVWPEPASSAAGSRMMQLLKIFLDKNWKIWYASPAANSLYAEKLEDLSIQSVKIKANDAGFTDFLKEIKPNVVMFDRFMMEEQFGWRVAENCPKAVRVLDTEDLHFFRKARYEAFKQNRNLKKSDLHSDEARREIASILRCDLSLIISEAEKDLLLKKFGINPALLLYLPFLLPKLEQASLEAYPNFNERKNFMFIGNFLHQPNWDAVLYLKQNIWPLIRQQLPEAELHIYGAYTRKKVKQLHNTQEGFLVQGRAENAGKTMQNAKVLLAPLRFGAGIKGKFIEAMQNGTPSITTTIGAEGIGGPHPWNGEIANTDQEVAIAAVRLYTNQKRWEKAQQYGLKIINNRFQKDLFTDAFIEELENLQKSLTTHRANNFMGSMLMHHSLKSTKYMALWIETKNKLKALEKE